MKSRSTSAAYVWVLIGLSLATTRCSRRPSNAPATHPTPASAESESQRPTVSSGKVPEPAQEELAIPQAATVQQETASATDSSREDALAIARDCISRRRGGYKLGHGSPLVYEKATVTRPSDLRARGEKGTSAGRPDNFRVVWIPESPPFDQRVPNGVALDVDLDTRQCSFPRYVR